MRDTLASIQVLAEVLGQGNYSHYWNHYPPGRTQNRTRRYVQCYLKYDVILDI